MAGPQVGTGAEGVARRGEHDRADREQSAIYVTDSHKDWFGRNLLAVLAEERLAFAVLDPDAICTVTSV